MSVGSLDRRVWMSTRIDGANLTRAIPASLSIPGSACYQRLPARQKCLLMSRTPEEDGNLLSFRSL